MVLGPVLGPNSGALQTDGLRSVGLSVGPERFSLTRVCIFPLRMIKTKLLDLWFAATRIQLVDVSAQ